ncbi:MAG TPA: acyl-CoA dehydrogenase family protein [Candidatus Dormibacteraeota bacterium]|jgi:butyryl-CoA dehydrogenase
MAAPVLNTQLDLTDEQRAVRDLAREFCEAEVKPHAAEWDEKHAFPYDAVAKMADLGFFGLAVPEEHGGSGGDFVSLCLAIEEISRGDTGLGITLEAAVGLGISPILRFGTDEQKRTYLPELAAGRRLWAFGLTEPHAGTDAGSTRTKARLEGVPGEAGSEWVIFGSKAFITNPGTDISWGVTVTAVTGEGAGEGRREISTIMVEKGTPGYIIDPPYRKLGWHSSDTHGLTFDGCRVPEENLLGQRGRGYAQFLSTLEAGRIAIAALSVGLAQACLDESLSYAKERVSFGVPISKHQAIQFKLADMAMEVHLARLATYHAANLWAQGRSCAMEAASAKLFASEASKRACDQAIQIHGGMGFMEESPVARFWRDVKVNEIGEGTSEVQRMLLAKHLGC